VKIKQTKIIKTNFLPISKAKKIYITIEIFNKKEFFEIAEKNNAIIFKDIQKYWFFNNKEMYFYIYDYKEKYEEEYEEESVIKNDRNK